MKASVELLKCVAAMCLLCQPILALEEDTLIRRLGDERAATRIDAAVELGKLKSAKAAAPLARCLADDSSGVRKAAREALVGIGQPTVKPLIEMLSHESSRARTAAAQVLGEIGDETATEALKKCENDEDAMVRFAASRALKEIETAKREGPKRKAEAEQAVSGELKALMEDLSDEDAFTRSKAARAIGELRAAQAVGPLVKCLGDENLGVRVASQKALEQIGSPAVKPLCKALSDENRDVRAGAARVLGRIGDKSAVAPLSKRLGDEDVRVKIEASRALRALGIDARPRARPEEEGDPLARLRSSNEFERSKAAKALGEVKTPEAAKALAESLGDENFGVRMAARKALVNMGRPAVEPLCAMLSHKSKEAREGAASALGEIGDERAIDALKTRLDDEDGRVRFAVAKALKDLGWVPETEEERIASAIGLKDWRELGRIGAPALDPLIEALPGASSNDQMSIIRLLGKMGDKAVDVIMPYAASESEQVRAAVAWSLGELGDKRATPVLVKALDDEKGLVQQAAVRALKELVWTPQTVDETVAYAMASRNPKMAARAGEEAVPKLMTYVKHREMRCRYAAVTALGLTADRRCADALIERLSDQKEHKIVRQAAAEALGEVGDKRAVLSLRECLVIWDFNRAAAGALDKLGWKPIAEVDKVHYLVAKRDRAGLELDLQQTKRILSADLLSKDKETEHNAVRALIALGREDSVDDLLRHLAAHGTPGVAEIYLNSGNEKLSEAAAAWAKKKGYTVMRFPVIGGKQSWGGM